MRSGGAIPPPPPQKRYLSDTCAIPHENKANGCDMNVRVFQGVRRGGPPAQRVWCRETFEMETGRLLALEFFNPEKGHAVKLRTPALPGCSPMLADRRSIRSVFWYSETDILPAHPPLCDTISKASCAIWGGALALGR